MTALDHIAHASSILWRVEAIWDGVWERRMLARAADELDDAAALLTGEAREYALDLARRVFAASLPILPYLGTLPDEIEALYEMAGGIRNEPVRIGFMQEAAE